MCLEVTLKPTRQDSGWSLVDSLRTSSGSGELVGSNLLEVRSGGVCAFGAVSTLGAPNHYFLGTFILQPLVSTRPFSVYWCLRTNFSNSSGVALRVILHPWNLADTSCRICRKSCAGHNLQLPLMETQAPSTAFQLAGSSRSAMDQGIQKDPR